MSDIDPMDVVSSQEVGAVAVEDSPRRPFRPFDISVDYQARVCYALAYNKVPTVKTITIRNLNGGISGQLTVECSITWSVGEIQPMEPWHVVVESPLVGAAVEVPGQDFRLNDAAMADLDEAAPARLQVKVSDSGGQEQSEFFDLLVLPRNQWINSSDLHQITAAFVQPNHPTVNEILRDAGSILAVKTGSSSLEGYQSGRERVIQIGEAIFLALQKRIDRYIDPPASFQKEGQQVRSIDRVLEERQGTCIDLACAYASCLEQAGLAPLVFLVHGHAFCGFFVEDRLSSSQPVVIDKFSSIITAIESGLIVAAETVVLPGTGSFSDAVARVRSHMRDRDLTCEFCSALTAHGISPNERGHLEALVNVLQCHKQGVLPLPARVVRDGIVTLVIDNGPSEPPVIERRDEKTRKLLPNTVPARVQQWKNALLDLSFRNQLLNYRPEKNGIQLLAPGTALGAIEDWVAAGQPIFAPPADSLDQIYKARGIRAAQQLAEAELGEIWRQTHGLFAAHETGTYATRVRGLISKAKIDEQDSGVNNLYLTFGSLIWNDPKASVGSVRSPIFMLPIRMTLKRGSIVPTITVDDGAGTTINYCLIEALRSRIGMKLEWFNDDMSDDFGLDIMTGLQQIRAEILDQRLTDQGFQVETDITVGILKFNKIRLWKDLNDHWEQFLGNPVVGHLVEGGRQLFIDPKNPDRQGISGVSDSDLLNPSPADGAQSQAIKRALEGHSFVLEGPPGTGKSQTITNLLANALARGKKVLFVAEKAAALSVVKERLEAVGLDPFCLDMHDKGSKPEDIKKQLRDALDFSPSADMNKWAEIDQAFAVVAQFLEAYRNKIHAPASTGLSFYDAYSRLLEIGDGQIAAVTRHLYSLDATVINSYREMLRGLEALASVAQPRHQHPYHLAGNVQFSAVDRETFAQSVRQISSGLAAISGGEDAWSRLFQLCSTIDEVEGVNASIRLVLEDCNPETSAWRDVVKADWADNCRDHLQRIEKVLSDSSHVLSGTSTKYLYEDLSSVVSAVKVAAESFVLGRKGKVKRALGELAGTELFSDCEPEAAVRDIALLSFVGVQFREAVANVKSMKGLSLDDSLLLEKSEVRSLVLRQIEMIEVAARFISGGSVVSERTLEALNGLSRPTNELLQSAEGIVAGYRGLQLVLLPTAESTELWLSDRGALEALKDSIATWMEDVESGTFKSLSRWLDFLAAVSVLSDDSVAQFRKQLLVGEINGHDALVAFDRGLMSITLQVVGEQHDLDVFDYAAHNRRIQDFVSLLKQREEILRSVIPYMLYEGRDFNAAAGVGAVAQLRQELGSKKRGSRSVRNLLSKYPNLIASLAPCFLMSPDSIAKFLEPGKIKFDLVVFDEASQIPVASAVGALGRAEAVVIVGDSRQMPPTMVGVATGSSEDEELVVLPDQDEPAVITDAESILDECLESGLEQEWLAWHYRSKDEILIKFSNDRYYDGRLSSFPSPFSKVPGCGISYMRVDGQFDHGGRRTNEIEANAIVAEVKRRANDPILSKSSIGIVTLNMEQRTLVEAKLSDLNDPAVSALIDSEDDDENLFVLNLESVQGRERDVIILGTSFSKRVGGGSMPLNFGPLTLRGGERRLNVAITRARKEVVIISSFEPDELSKANSLGMKHLCDYLKLAKAASEGVRPESNVPSPVSDDRHRVIVADALRDRGLIVKVGVGLSSFKVDLAVTLPGFEDRWLVGVLLDGKVWASRPLALDRDALPLTVLTNMMGWKRISRVWLPAWRNGRSEIIEDIFDAAVSASQEPVEVTPEPVPAAPTTSESSSPSEASPPSTAPVAKTSKDERPFIVPSPVVNLGSMAELDSISPRACELLKMYVENHGPVPIEQAIKFTANAFGLSVVRGPRLAKLHLLTADVHSEITEFGTFLYPSSVVENGEISSEFTWYRKSASSERRAQDISPHELANLMRSIVKDAYSIDRESLALAVLDILGYSRKTGDTVAFVDQVIGWAIEEDKLFVVDGQISINASQ